MGANLRIMVSLFEGKCLSETSMTSILSPITTPVDTEGKDSVDVYLRAKYFIRSLFVVSRV